MFLKGFWFFVVAAFFVFCLIATVTVFKGDYGMGEKAACVIALICLFLWSSVQFMNFSTDIMVPRVFRGRKIYIEQSGGGYTMLRIVDSLNVYFSQQGAITVDGPADAEFQINLSPSMMDPAAILCKMTDQQNYTVTFKEYGKYWPRSFALSFARFIRTSERQSVR